MRELHFSDGLEEYRLNDRVTVCFNPTDAGFLEKLTTTYEKLDALQGEVNAARETLKDEEIFPFAKAQDRKMRALIDSLFGCDLCAQLFGPMNLYASAGGFPVWANLMLCITEEVQSRMQGELKEREARIAKYTAKYQPSSSTHSSAPSGGAAEQSEAEGA